MDKNYCFDVLVSISNPCIFACFAGDDVSTAIDVLREEGRAVVIAIEGNKAKNVESLYEQISIAFNFPDYFGNNLNALLDCMEDERSKDEAPLILRFIHADGLLSDENCTSFHGFISTFTAIGENWARSIEEGEVWDSKSRRFALVLEYERNA